MGERNGGWGPPAERWLCRGVRLHHTIFPGNNPRCGDIDEVHRLLPLVCTRDLLDDVILNNASSDSFSKEKKRRKGKS
jgi:hypothetical protein